MNFLASKRYTGKEVIDQYLVTPKKHLFKDKMFVQDLTYITLLLLHQT